MAWPAAELRQTSIGSSLCRFSCSALCNLPGGSRRTKPLSPGLVIKVWPPSTAYLPTASGSPCLVAWSGRGSIQILATKDAAPLYFGKLPGSTRRVIKLTELSRIRFHDLRHTHASLLIAAGVHPKAIQARLGHASITTTLNVYGHLMPSAYEGVGRKLDQILRVTGGVTAGGLLSLGAGQIP